MDAPFNTPLLVRAAWDDPESDVTIGWAVAEKRLIHGGPGVEWRLCAAPHVCAVGAVILGPPLPESPFDLERG